MWFLRETIFFYFHVNFAVLLVKGGRQLRSQYLGQTLQVKMLHFSTKLTLCCCSVARCYGYAQFWYQEHGREHIHVKEAMFIFMSDVGEARYAKEGKGGGGVQWNKGKVMFI